MGNNCITITSKTNNEVECMRGIYAPNYKILVVHVICIHQYSEKGPKIEYMYMYYRSSKWQSFVVVQIGNKSPFHTRSRPAPSTMVLLSMSIMLRLLFICTGKCNCNAHIDALGLHWQPGLHPWTICRVICSGNQRGGITSVPVINFISLPGLELALSKTNWQNYFLTANIAQWIT